MTVGRRQLFAYWRVEVDRLPQVLAAMQVWQSGRCREIGGLVASLYVRDDAGPDATVMEAYAMTAMTQPEGLTGTQLAALGAPQVDGPWPAGRRRFEVFDAVTAPGG